MGISFVEQSWGLLLGCWCIATRACCKHTQWDSGVRLRLPIDNQSNWGSKLGLGSAELFTRFVFKFSCRFFKVLFSVYFISPKTIPVFVLPFHIWSDFLREKPNSKYKLQTVCPIFFRSNQSSLWQQSCLLCHFYLSKLLFFRRHFCGLGFVTILRYVPSAHARCFNRVSPPVPHLMPWPSHKTRITSCPFAPPHSQSAHPKNPSRHPVTSLSQLCHKTCTSPHDNYMVGRALR